ncbi:hypothetical protein [Amaricoccus sp.]|uniref:hypothetical protein n=1 Tax=Amaricoccus sp. TaxID=1872485 RepID=UPI001B5C91B1|nr:hypothetical protein [Amaricoccus sp.]MBP7241937.1 hypothetical protein [Amaricoccus sp.]
MTPDGSHFAPAPAPMSTPDPTPTPPVALPHCGAALIAGGRAVLFFEGAETAPPSAGVLAQGGALTPWRAHVWKDEACLWRGVALTGFAPAPGAEVRATGSDWRFATAPRLDVAPGPLAAFVRRAGREARGAIAFVASALADDRDASPETLDARRAFLRAFVAAAAERDGFVEILAAPDTGGLVAQGWSMSLAPGRTTLTEPDANGTIEVEVAEFEREDLLAPARGVCIFGKFWSADTAAALEAVFFEKDGRLLRLDVVRDALRLDGPAATEHVAHMLPRLVAPEEAGAAFRRVCRPRFQGTDTLSGTAEPIAAALDLVLRAPDGGLLVIGWLLDPERRAELLLVKSTANLYARLDRILLPLPRPDLIDGFGADPRFAGRLDPRDAMHGFVAHVPAEPEMTADTRIYLEIVLDDGTCLFRPVTAAQAAGPERLPQVLAALAAAGPEVERIVEEHVAPFLAGVPPRAPRRRASRDRAIPLGGGPAGRATTALVPFASLAELQPVMALLSGAPEATALDLTLVAPRAAAADALPALKAAFDLYGLTGALTLAADGAGRAARLDLGLAASDAPQILVWTPAALPQGPGWLAALEAEAAGLPGPAALSPALVYEDGSVFFGAGREHDPAGGCSLAGFSAARLARGGPRRAACGAAEIMLAPRAAIETAGGFEGRLFGDDFAHVDLGERLASAGVTSWCSGAVTFWLIEAPLDAAEAHETRLIRRIDAALLARRGLSVRERTR